MNKKSKILIVDDDPNIIRLLRVNLENKGYVVRTSLTGSKALAILQREKMDLIILDIMLPDFDGYEVCQRIREHEGDITTPVMIISAKDKPMDKIAALRLGADEYITKPFDIEEFLTRVDSMLKRADQMLSVNPLTELPGNVSIITEVNKRLCRREKFAFAYLDIDNFKAFNDKYGFNKGDRVIMFTAEILKKASDKKDFIGHIGGDDFVIICDSDKIESLCDRVIEEFDFRIPQFYNPADRRRGYILSEDRQNEMQEFPIMALSIGIVKNNKKIYPHYAKFIETATELKNYLKINKKPGESAYIENRRKESTPGEIR